MMNACNFSFFILLMLKVAGSTSSLAGNDASKISAKADKEDLAAENMLLWQRACGGWPKDTYPILFDDTKENPGVKQPEKVLIRYDQEQTAEQKKLAFDSRNFNDATIDNDHTVKEIRYLLGAFKTTGNIKYVNGAKRGIDYLLLAQFPNGGWPMFYPDKRIYKGYITYNDNAMNNVMDLLFDIAHHLNNTEFSDPAYVTKAEKAFDKGVEVILKTQIIKNGKKTVWCAQHDPVTLAPAQARSYELPSLSGSESVGIVQVLMRIEKPSAAVKQAITSAVEWFESAKISGYKTQRIKDAAQPKGQDVVLVPETGAVLWARFYDLDTNKPYFCDRDGIKKSTLAEIGNERRTGYSWYGTWPQQLLETEYPAWAKKWAD